MYTIFNMAEKTDLKDEIRRVKVDAEKLPEFLENEGIEIEFKHGDATVQMFFFDTEEAAEECML